MNSDFLNPEYMYGQQQQQHRPPTDLLRNDIPTHAPPMHIDEPLPLMEAPPPQQKSKRGYEEATYYTTLALCVAVPTGIVEGVLQCVPTMRSASCAAIVGGASAMSALGGLFAARAAVGKRERLAPKLLYLTMVNATVMSMLASALASRLDMRVRDFTSGAVVGAFAAVGALNGAFIAH